MKFKALLKKTSKFIKTNMLLFVLLCIGLLLGMANVAYAASGFGDTETGTVTVPSSNSTYNFRSYLHFQMAILTDDVDINGDRIAEDPFGYQVLYNSYDKMEGTFEDCKYWILGNVAALEEEVSGVNAGLGLRAGATYNNEGANATVTLDTTALYLSMLEKYPDEMADLPDLIIKNIQYKISVYDPSNNWKLITTWDNIAQAKEFKYTANGVKLTSSQISYLEGKYDGKLLSHGDDYTIEAPAIVTINYKCDKDAGEEILVNGVPSGDSKISKAFKCFNYTVGDLRQSNGLSLLNGSNQVVTASKQGYKFVKWSFTNRNNETRTRKNGAVMPLGRDDDQYTFTAIFEPEPASKVKYHKNDGSGKIVETVKVQNGTDYTIENINAGTHIKGKDAYKFKFWASTPTGTKSVVGKTITVTSDKNYYAIWEEIKEPDLNVYYHSAKGEDDVHEVVSGYKKGETTKIGYKKNETTKINTSSLPNFIGWAYGKTSTKDRTGNISTALNADRHYYAIYSGVPTPIPEDEDDDQPTASPSPTPTPTPTPLPALLQYDGNGATSGYTQSAVNDSYLAGENHIVEKNAFYKAGSHFKGYWTTAPNGGTKYIPGDNYYLAADAGIEHLYAQWDINQYLLTFDYNADYCTTAETLQKGTYGDSLVGGEPYKIYDVYDQSGETFVEGVTDADTKLLTFAATIGELPEPTINGYAFKGWSYRLDEFGNGYDGDRVRSTDRAEFSKNKLVYARWEPKKYRVSLDYNFNYGNYPADNPRKNTLSGLDYVDLYCGDQYTGLPVPTRDGYTFNGWFLTEENDNGTGTNVNDVTMSQYASHTVYAKWTPNSYNLHFHPNGGSVSPDVKRVTYDELVGELPVPTYDEDHSFVEWNVSPKGTAATITPDYLYKTAGDMTIYAVWVAAQCTVRFDYNMDYGLNDQSAVNPAGFSTTQMFLNYGAAYVSLPLPSRDGYTFCGWYTEETGNNGSGTHVYNDSVCTQAGTHILYAKWIPNAYLVYYDYNYSYISPNDHEQY